MIPVTDPNILAQLNGGGMLQQMGNNMQAVSDPAILQQLNGGQGGQNGFNPSFFEKLAPNIVAGLAQMGHGILNVPSNMARGAANLGWIGRDTANAVPRQQDYDFSEMLKLPGTTGDKIVQSLVKNAPAVALPEVKGIGYLPQAASRIMGQGIWGGLMNEKNPHEGLKEFAGTQAAMEALGLPFRGLGQVAEWINPLKYTKNSISDIKGGFENAVKEQKAAYKPVTDQYGDTWMSVTPEKYLGFGKSETKYFTPEVKKLYGDFIDEPTFNNLHALQSQMGKDWARMSTNPGKINTAQTLNMARQSLNQKITNFLSQDANALAQYQKGAEITKNQVAPYLSTPTLRKIAAGKIDSMSPAQLANAIAKGTQKEVGGIPEMHPLNELLGKLTNRTNIGQSIQNALPIALGGLGAMGGNMIHPGLGTLAGAGGAAAAAKYLAPSALNLAQNPFIVKLLQGYVNPAIQGAGREAVGYNMSRQ